MSGCGEAPGDAHHKDFFIGYPEHGETTPHPEYPRRNFTRDRAPAGAMNTNVSVLSTARLGGDQKNALRDKSAPVKLGECYAWALVGVLCAKHK